MAKSVDTMRTEIMNEFGLAEDNDNEGTSAESITRYISEANAEFINYRAWRFRLKPYTRFIEPDTTVKTLFTTAASSAVLNQTDNWGTTGRVMIDFNVIEFTNNNTGTDTLTIVTADIQRTHDIGEKCLLMYEVPSDYNKYAYLEINGVPYKIEDKRDGKFPSPRRFWEEEVMLTNGNIKKYLVFPYHTTQQKIFLRYGKKATDFTVNGLDLSLVYIEVPEPYWTFIYHKVSARIYRHLEEHKQAGVHDEKAFEMLRKAAVFDSKQHYGNRIPIRTEWDNPAARLGISSGRGMGRWGHFNSNLL